MYELCTSYFLFFPENILIQPFLLFDLSSYNSTVHVVWTLYNLFLFFPWEYPYPTFLTKQFLIFLCSKDCGPGWGYWDSLDCLHSEPVQIGAQTLSISSPLPSPPFNVFFLFVCFSFIVGTWNSKGTAVTISLNSGSRMECRSLWVRHQGLYTQRHPPSSLPSGVDLVHWSLSSNTSRIFLLANLWMLFYEKKN